jgi:hypothetical protein
MGDPCKSSFSTRIILSSVPSPSTSPAITFWH